MSVVQETSSPVDLPSYHGDAGLLLFDCCMLTVFVGLAAYLQLSFTSLLVELLPLLLWVTVHCHMRLKGPIASVARDQNDAMERHGMLVVDDAEQPGPETLI